ncbi:unnamed protein product [Caenorhabditis nigoni]
MDRRQTPSMTPEERTRIMEEQMHQKLAQIQQIREREARGQQQQLAPEPGPNNAAMNHRSATSVTPEERARIMEEQMHQKLAQRQQILDRQRREREIRAREEQERQERLAREAREDS